MIHKIPRSVRRYILLPIISVIALIVMGMVGKLIWLVGTYGYKKIGTETFNNFMSLMKKLAGYLSSGVRENAAIVTTIAYLLLVLAGIRLIRWARSRNYLKVSTPRIILIIAVVLGWLTWKIITFLHQGIQVGFGIGTTVFYLIFTILPLGAAIFVWSSLMERYGGTWYTEIKNRWWWRENEFFILVGIVALHLDIFTVWPEWWIAHVWLDHRIWWLHGILIVFALLIPKADSDTPYHHKLGRIGVIVATASMVFIFIWKPTPDANAQTLAQEIEKAKANAFALTPLPSDADPEVVVIARNKFRNYPFLFTVAIHESHLRQYEMINREKHLLLANLEDGTKGTATGVMQIKSDLYTDYCMKKGADLTTPEGNIDCSIIMYKDPKIGPDAWYPEKGGVYEFDLVATKGAWTEPLLLPKAPAALSYGNFVERRDDNSPAPYPISGPGIRRNTPKPISIMEFRVPAKAAYETAIIHVDYTYPPRPILSAKNQ